MSLENSLHLSQGASCQERSSAIGTKHLPVKTGASQSLARKKLLTSAGESGGACGTPPAQARTSGGSGPSRGAVPSVAAAGRNSGKEQWRAATSGGSAAPDAVPRSADPATRVSRSRQAPAHGARCLRHAWQPERRSRGGARSGARPGATSNRKWRILTGLRRHNTLFTVRG